MNRADWTAANQNATDVAPAGSVSKQGDPRPNVESPLAANDAPTERRSSTPWAGDEDLRRALMAERFGSVRALTKERPKTPAQLMKTKRRET